jgi:hypothetical protein
MLEPQRTFGRAPVYQILYLQGPRGHTIPGRGFNLFKALRRHFRATPFCRQVLSRRDDPGDGNASAKKIDDPPRRSPPEGGAGTNIERLRNFGKKFVERLGNYIQIGKAAPLVTRACRGSTPFAGGAPPQAKPAATFQPVLWASLADPPTSYRLTETLSPN